MSSSFHPRECDLPELDGLMGGFLGGISVNRYLYEDPILTAGYREYTSGRPDAGYLLEAERPWAGLDGEKV